MKEMYENLKILLEKIQYDTYRWTICCDLKVIALLMGLQLGYTKFYFLCEWDGRDKRNHYIKKEWPKRESLTPGQKNVVHSSLVNSDMIILPSLHIKLGLFKNFVKARDKNGAGFHYLKEKLSCVSDSKIKEGIFVGPQIRALIRDGNFDDLLNQIEKSAWKSFKSVKIFLGNHKAPNYREIVGELLQSYQDMGLICPSRYNSWTPTWISFLTIFVPSVTNTGNVSTKTFLPWKRGTRDRGVQECLDDEEGCSRCQAQKAINNPHILVKVNNVCSM